MRFLIDNNLSPQVAAEIILANLETIADDLTSGTIVVTGDDKVRIRSLPILPRKR